MKVSAEERRAEVPVGLTLKIDPPIDGYFKAVVWARADGVGVRTEGLSRSKLRAIAFACEAMAIELKARAR